MLFGAESIISPPKKFEQCTHLEHILVQGFNISSFSLFVQLVYFVQFATLQGFQVIVAS